ncbi:MAG: CRISPR system precrRNA processing endoribonuclease RAMP protein Cas6, partial [Candidatus Nitrosocaldaceae archaeon]
MLVARAKIKFRVSNDLIIPPFSSKVSRSMIMKILGEDNQLFKNNIKPYVISPIFNNNKPLIKHTNDNTLKLFANNDYYFYFTTLSIEPITKVIEISNIEVFNTIFNIKDYELEVKTFGSLMIDMDKVNIKIITPLLLKLPTKWSNIKRKRNLLFPIPSLMLWSLAHHWNMFAPEELRIPNIKRLVIFSNYSMLEFNYHIMPLSIVYDEHRKPTGISGWIQFIIDSNDREYKIMLKRLLA